MITVSVPKQSSQTLIKWAKETLNVQEWKEPPLWLCLERFLAIKKPDMRVTGVDWERAIQVWDQLERIMSCPEDSHVFTKSLSRLQHESWKVLHHWWHSTYQDSRLTSGVKEYIAGIVKGQQNFEPTVRLYCGLDLSLYHQWCFGLWEREIFLHAHAGSTLLSNNQAEGRIIWKCMKGLVRTTRESTLPLASKQRIAFAALSYHNRTLSVPQVSDSAINKPIPDPIVLAVSEVGDTCSWLKDKDVYHVFPRFLWNIESRRTVDTQAEQTDFSQIEYTCVSHTWGRFRIPGRGVSITGCPWEVPRNTHFCAENLPQMLLSAWRSGRLRTEYLWLDLLCIPQSDDFTRDTEYASLVESEIDRQAGIFRNATFCIMWLHDPSMISWNSTLRAIRWCSVDWLSKSTAPEIYNVDEILPNLFEKAKEPVDFTLVSDRSRTWFSSLWTLQEACLRPSMIIVNYNWDPLVDDGGTYIMLDNLLSVSHTKDSYKWNDTCSEPSIVNPLDEAWFDQAVAPIYKKASVRPLGAQQLYDLYHGDHGVGLITQPSQSAILAMGSHRHSQDNVDRPRSIQSVLGLTGWNQDATEHEKSVFVLGLYPLTFVRAASQSIGGSFYGCDMRLTPGTYNALKDPWRAGSMMCFTAPDNQERLTSLPYHHRDPELGSMDNPATRTWIINADGSVCIAQAAILASHEGVMIYSDIDHEAADFISWNRVGTEIRTVSMLLKTANNQGQRDVFNCDDIRMFLQEQPGEIKTYLVAINSVFPIHPEDDMGPTHHGIIIQGTDIKRLRKIGTYMISGYKEVSSFPSVQEVNWVVL